MKAPADAERYEVLISQIKSLDGEWARNVLLELAERCREDYFDVAVVAHVVSDVGGVPSAYEDDDFGEDDDE